MRVENLSIKMVTICIFVMISLAAVVLSLLAGAYFRQSALDAQMNSLSRVIEVATGQVFRQLRDNAYHLGMTLVQDNEFTRLLDVKNQGGREIVHLLDDPFINGYVGLPRVSLEKLRLYTPDLQLIAESSRGRKDLGKTLPPELAARLASREGVQRLRSTSSLWISPSGPLLSTIVPVGGLSLVAYLEIVTDPARNLPEISDITNTPVSVFGADGEPLHQNQPLQAGTVLPVHFIIRTGEGKTAYRVTGHEDVAGLLERMDSIRTTTIAYFLSLIMIVLGLALWLFHRHLFVPAERLVQDMERMSAGESVTGDRRRALSEFDRLYTTFLEMCQRIRHKTRELTESHNRLLTLLDLDEHAILYLDKDYAVCYANRAARNLFDYSDSDICGLRLTDLLTEKMPTALLDAFPDRPPLLRNYQVRLQCLKANGETFCCNALISTSNDSSTPGYAVALREIRQQEPMDEDPTSERIRSVEQSLNSLLEIARRNPLLLNTGGDRLEAGVAETPDAKASIRECAVSVMCSALACWEHETGTGKTQLAEESGIWTVYIDKSTPTTRTLDRYLSLETCPSNPRCQRVIQTAEFVLRSSKESDARNALKTALEELRQCMAGNTG